MRSKLLNLTRYIPFTTQKEKKLLVKMLIMAGYVAMYYVTQYVAGIQAAEKLQGLAKLLQAANGG